jgi:hypothetical protein
MPDLEQAIAAMGDNVTVRTGVVAAMGSPMTVTVQSTNIPCGLIDGGGFFPRVGDTVAIIGQGDSWLCIGPIRPTGRAARYGCALQRGLTVQVFGSGVTTSYIWDILEDPYGFVTGGAGTANITIPAAGAGVYSMTAGFEFAGTGGFNFGQFTNVAFGYRSFFGAGTDVGLAAIHRFAASTVFNVQGFQNSGVNQGTICAFEMWRIG